MNVRIVSMAFGLGFVGAGYAQRPLDPHQDRVPRILRRLLATSEHQRYSGIRTVEFRFGEKTDRHSEIVVRLGKSYRVEFPADSKLAGQVIVETEDSRRQFFPDKNEVWVQPPRREAAMEHLQMFVREPDKWKYETTQGELVAGRKTRQVVISDAKGNVVQRLWIDPWASMLLKRQIFDPVGAQVASFEFTEIDFDPHINERTFVFDPKGAKIVTPAIQLERAAKKAKIEVYTLASSTGYRLDSSRVMQKDGKSILVQHYVSKAGRISIFQFDSKVSVDSEMVRRMARGEMQSFQLSLGRSSFVLVGSVDPSVLERLSKHLVPGTGAAAD